MERAGKLHQLVQQNHDGLPQKAGFPQEKINEIHGGWYDPSNTVVKFDGSLRDDLFAWLLEVEERVDLCLCLGTSLSGMNADRIATTPASRSSKPAPETLGTVVINLQQTPLDSHALIRVWAKLDDAFRLLAKNLELVDIRKYEVPIPECDVYEIPYNTNGFLDTSVRMIWDLRPGAAVVVPHPESKNYGAVGKITSKRDDGHYIVVLNELTQFGKRDMNRLLGKWWINCALHRSVPRIPIVNVGAVISPM